MQTADKRAVIWGAGHIDRGFVAQILREGGYMIDFVDRDAALEEAKRLLDVLDRRWPDCTHPDSWRTTLRILRRWTASPDALFAPEPVAG